MPSDQPDVAISDRQELPVDSNALSGLARATLRGEGVTAGSEDLAKHEEHEGKHHEEEKLRLGIDLTLGFGRTDYAAQRLPTSLQTLPSYGVDSTRVSTQSAFPDSILARSRT